MAINYSLGVHLSKPNDKSSEKKVYAHAQAREVLQLEDLADHIQEHGSPYTADIILGVSRKLVSCIREQLLDGNKVCLGRLGAFYISLKSEGVDDAATFNAAENIKAVNVRWDRGSDFKNLLGKAKFEYVTTRKQQSASRKQEKQALNVKIAAVSEGGE